MAESLERLRTRIIGRKARLPHAKAPVLLVRQRAARHQRGAGGVAGLFPPAYFGPSNAKQTLIFWAVSTLIFILMVTVGWILAREFIKLYVARQAKRLGSRIRTKLVVGAMLLSCVPVFFLVLWSYEVLNVNLKAWFTNPVENQVEVYKRAARALDQEIQHRLAVQATLLAAQPETQQLLDQRRHPARRSCSASPRSRDSIRSRSYRPTARRSRAWGPFPAQPEDGKIAVLALPLPNGLIELSTPHPAGCRRTAPGDQEVQRRVGGDHRQPPRLSLRCT